MAYRVLFYFGIHVLCAVLAGVQFSCPQCWIWFLLLTCGARHVIRSDPFIGPTGFHCKLSNRLSETILFSIDLINFYFNNLESAYVWELHETMVFARCYCLHINMCNFAVPILHLCSYCTS